tara:strand:- start:193 stop:384 length:192 start_codon:yes stop_codon:yes gene_type:complete
MKYKDNNMYKEIETYKDVDSFIEAHDGLWQMLGAKYKKLDEETVVIDNTTWKLKKGNMTCLTK